ncbi:hypothetical protein T05_16036 [Trichinella murrelli]|uniref:Uncharacterized protein n=1 Tax=Trichinella murrelli TaxID=144512 RepID=A0A0V0TRX7_9BILA|nr:hypothetical protein T05_16036 [Trichinella murrelli]
MRVEFLVSKIGFFLVADAELRLVKQHLEAFVVNIK